MKEIPPERLRNIGIAAHIDAGKTTLTERILFYTGKTHRIGEVHTGDTIMDYLEEERERGITITAAATQTRWPWEGKEYVVNIIDTPGHVDFTAEVERSMRVLDGLIVLFSAVHGVEPQSETVWRQADRYRVPRLAFINKMDLAGADFFGVIEQMKKRLATRPVAIQIPIGEEMAFQGMIDLLTRRAFFWGEEGLQAEPVPGELVSEVEQRRTQLVEVLAEFDEAIMRQFFEDPAAVTAEELRLALRQATLRRELVPVLCGSAYKNKGAEPLLDAVCALLPSPVDVGAVRGIDPGTGGELKRSLKLDDPFAALIFKIALDEQGRKMAFFRVYSGEVRRGTVVLNPRTGERERLSNLYQLHGGKRNAVYEVSAGDIAAVQGPKDLITGDTICDEAAPVILERIQFPQPVIGMVIEAKRTSDIDALHEALHKIEEEDPSFQVLEDEETGQTIIRGMGELHLEIIVHRLAHDFKLEANVGRPQVTYREQLSTTITHTQTFDRELGNQHLYARITFEIGPADPEFLGSEAFQSGESRLQFVNALSAEALAPNLADAVRRGFAGMLTVGPLAGHEMHNLKVRLTAAEADPHRSNELAFDLCAREGFREAAPLAAPVIMEPVMDVEVSCPEEYVGAVVGDINRRRGIPKGMETKGGYTIVKAEVPLAELFGYASDLRNLTAGRGAAALTFSHYV